MVAFKLFYISVSSNKYALKMWTMVKSDLWNVEVGEDRLVFFCISLNPVSCVEKILVTPCVGPNNLDISLLDFYHFLLQLMLFPQLSYIKLSTLNSLWVFCE